MNDNRFRKENFFINIDKYKSYLLGFIYADGHVCKRGYEISLTCSEKDFVNINNIFNNFIGWRFEKINKKLKNKNFIIYSFRYSGKLTNLFLKENDYYEKSELSPIKILEKIPKELHNHFYRGYIDGDGSFSYYGKKLCKFNITSTIEQDWTAIEDLFKKQNW